MAEFIHGTINKTKADEMLLANGGESTPGKFLIRAKKTSPNDFILSVIYKGAPTHHTVARESEGAVITVNKNSTGKTTLVDVIEYLRSKQPKWPVPLTDGVSVGGSGTTARPKVAAAPVGASSASGGGAGGMSKYFHGMIKKENAERLLSADGGNDVSGKFLFRAKKEEGKYLLSVVYKGNPTHHTIETDDDGKLLLNKAATGQSTLSDLVEHLRTKKPKWPVPLTQGVPGPGGGSGDGNGGGGGTAAVGGTGVTVVPAGPVVESDADYQFFHGKINKEKAEAKLGDDSSDGTFLFRAKAKKGEYLLSVVYKGKPTHHTVTNAETSTFTLNKNPTQCKTLQDLAKWLESKRSKWPVPLTKGITREGYIAATLIGPAAALAADPAVEATPPSSAVAQEQFVVSEVNTALPSKASDSEKEAQIEAMTSKISNLTAALEAKQIELDEHNQNMRVSVPTEVDANRPSYVWDEITREDADIKLANKNDGTFLLRSQPEAGRFYLAVNFRSKATHHSFDLINGSYMVNDKPMGDKQTVEACVNHMRLSQRNWPVMLTDGIANPDIAPPVKEDLIGKRMKLKSELENLKSDAKQAEKQKHMLELVRGRASVVPEDPNDVKARLLTSGKLMRGRRSSLTRKGERIKMDKEQAERELNELEAARLEIDAQLGHETSPDRRQELQVAASKTEYGLKRARRSVADLSAQEDDTKRMSNFVSEENQELLAKQLAAMAAASDSEQPGEDGLPSFPTATPVSLNYPSLAKSVKPERSMIIADDEGEIQQRFYALLQNEKVNIRREPLTGIKARLLCEALRTNGSQIKELRLYDNSLSRSTVSAIAKALITNHSLTHLQISANKIDDETCRIIANCLEQNSGLRMLSLRENHISDQGARHIAAALVNNRTLIDLSLRRNSIGNHGITALVTALTQNATLQTMTLYDNPFQGPKAIMQACREMSACNVRVVAPVW